MSGEKALQKKDELVEKADQKLQDQSAIDRA
jgi:hypothetical protein